MSASATIPDRLMCLGFDTLFTRVVDSWAAALSGKMADSRISVRGSV
jgi:hypothetical protein